MKRRRIRRESLQLRRGRGKLQLLQGRRKRPRRRGKQASRWSRKKKRFILENVLFLVGDVTKSFP